ncbi:MAG: phosphoenolpyruvate carboxykinase (GTP) [Endomicrobium sp.]|jgi:phosphoenolpyruvate carboxykinase (GTP)|nr:phosphoenolpyruvate carboxykinase (GTP) [Endomicrobium sp.]
MVTPLNLFIKEMKELFQCSEVYIMNGTQKEAEKLITIAQNSKFDDRVILKKLNVKEYPNSYYHRSNPNDVSRTEDLTFVCTNLKEQAGPNNNWIKPKIAKIKMLKLFKNAMKNKIMYVIPFIMGIPDSKYEKNCVQVTDSVYVALSMRIMTRVGDQAISKINNNSEFFKGIHSIGDLNPKKRFIMHFPEENLVMSFGSGYGGNALLGKKCYSLRICSYLGYKEGWFAEHMIIIGVQIPNGKIIYLLAAFPSACGKTNLALLESIFKEYKIWTLGDDIAWININEDGQLYAANPETGFFGVAPGTSFKTNPVMMKTLKNNKFFPTLFTNTAIYNDIPWWEGVSDNIPSNLINWYGKKYCKDTDGPAAHPNSRFTVSIYNCPTLSPEYYNPNGVPISGIIFGSRRSNTIPLICEAKNWTNGVFMASVMGSETTTASNGSIGNIRRDPMAMLPFCGYNLGDYFQHWLNVSKRTKKLPKIFIANWFRKDKNNKFIWPGFRDNSRVIKWIIDRINKKIDANESEIGFLPKRGTIDLNGLNIDNEKIELLFKLDKKEWIIEIAMIEKFYSKFGDKIPKELKNCLKELKRKFKI